MTQEQFDNQQWYKNMPVKLVGDFGTIYYVKGVRLYNGKIGICSYKDGQWGIRWESFTDIEIVVQQSTAIDLIAAEKHELEKQAWYNDGVVTGLRICKELWAQGTISHEQIREIELYYLDELKSTRRKLDNLEQKEAQ